MSFKITRQLLCFLYRRASAFVTSAYSAVRNRYQNCKHANCNVAVTHIQHTKILSKCEIAILQLYILQHCTLQPFYNGLRSPGSMPCLAEKIFSFPFLGNVINLRGDDTLTIVTTTLVRQLGPSIA